MIAKHAIRLTEFKRILRESMSSIPKIVQRLNLIEFNESHISSKEPINTLDFLRDLSPESYEIWVMDSGIEYLVLKN